MATGTMWGCGHITAAGLPACPVCEQIDDLRAEVERLRIECPACVSESAVAIRERDEARAALRELVRLKDIKEAGPLDHATALVMGRDYEASKPAAWAEARRVLAGALNPN